MSKYIFNLPDIGEGIAEAEIVKWHVKVGDVVAEDDQLADVMTDKATVEMEAPVSGTITAIAGEEGDILSIGSMLVEIEVEGDVDLEELEELEASDGNRDKPEPAAAKSVQDTEIKEEKPKEGAPSEVQKESEESPATDTEEADAKPSDEGRQKVLATPAVRKRAADLGVDLSQVKAQGDHPAQRS